MLHLIYIPIFHQHYNTPLVFGPFRPFITCWGENQNRVISLVAHNGALRSI